MNAPKLAGAPSDNASVAGTVPPTVPSTPVVTVPKANVCDPVTPLNSTAPSLCTAVTPGAGAPSCQTTAPSIAIVRERPSSGTRTVPEVPAGADTVRANERFPSPRVQRETSPPCGVGTVPCAHFRSPVCGATSHVL